MPASLSHYWTGPYITPEVTEKTLHHQTVYTVSLLPPYFKDFDYLLNFYSPHLSFCEPDTEVGLRAGCYPSRRPEPDIAARRAGQPSSKDEDLRTGA